MPTTENGHRREDVARFFRAFETAQRDGDDRALGECFAEVFLAGDAGGARPVPRAAFVGALPGRRAAAAEAGVGPAALDRVDVVDLGEQWVLARTHWSAPRAGGGVLPMASSFLLHQQGQAWRVAAYLNHAGLDLHTGRPGPGAPATAG